MPEAATYRWWDGGGQRRGTAGVRSNVLASAALLLPWDPARPGGVAAIGNGVQKCEASVGIGLEVQSYSIFKRNAPFSTYFRGRVVF